MKRAYISIILAALALSGCSLDRYPETKLTDQTFWRSETDLRTACNRMYEQLQGFNHDRRADELVGTSPDDVSTGGRVTPSESKSNWNDHYDRINTANNILDKATRATVPEAVLNRYVAEARFFRAYHHFILLKLYGDVPLIMKSFDDPSDPVLLSGRTPREKVVQQCYDDLEFAATWLPTMKTLKAADWGRVTRSAALGLTARIGLYEGTFTKYHAVSGANPKSHLKKSTEAVELLMKEGHKLYSDFGELFTFKGEGAKNPENVMVKVYGPNGVGAGAGTVFHKNSREMENSVSLTRAMVDLFLYDDGLPREKSPKKISPETSFDDALTARDPRLKMTVFSLNEEAFKGSYSPFVNQHGNGYSLKKGFMIDQWTTINKETVDKMLIRWGEMLVTYAEALWEYNDGVITDKQLDATVNALRARAGFGVKLTGDFVTAHGLDMLTEIRRERTVELLDEGFRYDDIIRWKIAEKVLPVAIVGAKFVTGETSKAYDDLKVRLTDAEGKIDGVKVADEQNLYVIEKADTRKFDPAKDYLYPIPVKEIALSKGNITQNPKW